MKTSQIQIVLNNVKRALLAEEKQGFTNGGVLGGFNTFLRGVIPRLEQIFPGKDMELLTMLAQNYAAFSPLRRREAFSEIRRFMQEIEAESQASESQNEVIKNQHTSLVSPQGGFSEAKTPASVIKGLPQQLQQERKKSSPEGAGRIKKTMGKKNTVQKSRPLQYLKGVGPERAKQLEQLGIRSIRDLLQYYPRRYEERCRRRIVDLKDGELATIEGKVVAGNVIRGKLKVVKLCIEQGNSFVHAIWFNQTFVLKQYPVGSQVAVTGKVRWRQQVPELLATEIEWADKEGSHTIREQNKETLFPVYSETARLSSKVIRTLIRSNIEKVEEEFPEILPPEDLKGWMDRPAAYKEIHFPKNHATLASARARLVWEEILFLQLAVAGLRRNIARSESPVLLGGEELIQSFYSRLSFRLTGAQQRVIREITGDMSQPQGMTRLVQGDVGSGKTVIAMVALLRAVGSGYQGALMAPTEILAVQHFQSLEKIFAPMGISVVCLLGSQTKGTREKLIRMIADGSAQVVVGTHALIQDAVRFKALGLAVTDEQHRFGVRQRTMLQDKGQNPHVLVLTATPIPRTLALTLYGDLQISVLDEMPAGRRPIITRRLTEASRTKMEKFLEAQIDSGRQVYVVCPLVDESEALDLISATRRMSDLQRTFPNYRLALLHGKMKGSEKEEIMNAFNGGNIDILVATTVVEVGINVPNASVMVIESAQRFGLAQLHQLRGRVGRGSEQSYCFLMTDSKNTKRLDILCHTEDGFKIAEEDMRLRGIGELLGTRQHGLAELRLADPFRDAQLVEKAYQMVQKITKNPQTYDLLMKEVRNSFPPEGIGVN